MTLSADKTDAIILENARLRAASLEREAEIERLRADNALYRAKAAGDYWAWQGDGSDHLESLVCPVLIRPEKLLELFAALAQWVPDSCGKVYGLCLYCRNSEGWDAGEAVRHDADCPWLKARKLLEARP